MASGGWGLRQQGVTMAMQQSEPENAGTLNAETFSGPLSVAETRHMGAISYNYTPAQLTAYSSELNVCAPWKRGLVWGLHRVREA